MRAVAWIVATLALLVVLALGGLDFALRQPSVERAIIERLGAVVAQQTGLDLGIGQLRMSLVRTSAHIEDFRLGSPGNESFVAADRIDVALRLRSLWRDPLTLSRLLISDLHLDLDQPLPRPTRAGDQASTGLALAIEHFEIEDGAIDGPVVPTQLETWIERWWLEDVEIRGSISAAQIEASLESTGKWQRQDGRTVEVAIEGEVAGVAEGLWRVSRLALSGEGIYAEISGVAGSAESDPFEFVFESTLEPHLLIPVPAASAPIQLSGEVDVRGRRGSLNLHAKGLPSELASPWLERDGEPGDSIQGWRIDTDLQLSSAGLETDLEGSGDLRVWRGDRTWLSAGLELRRGEEPSNFLIELETRVLPDDPGQRSLKGDVIVSGPLETADLKLSSGEMLITDTDLGILVDALETFQPGLVAEKLRPSLVGRLDATGRFEGPLDALRVELEGSLMDGDGGLVQLRASGVPQERIIEAEMSVDGLNLSRISPQIRGQLTVRGSAEVRGEAVRWQAQLAGAEIGGAETDSVVDPLVIALSGDDRRILLDDLSGRFDGHPFRGKGSLELPTPITRAELSLSMDEPWPGLDHVHASLSLSDGVIALSAQPATSNRAVSQIEATLPWAALARRPELVDALSGLPIAGREGPIRVSWSIPEADWIGVLAELMESPPLTSLRLGSRGSLTFDPGQPLAGTGEITAEGLRVESPDLAISAQQPLKLRLEGGQLVLEPTGFATEEGELELEIWSELATAWQPGDEISSTLQRIEIEANGILPLALVERFGDGWKAEGDLQLALSLAGSAREVVGELRLLGPAARLSLSEEDGPQISRPELSVVFAGDRLRIERARLGLDDGEIIVSGETSLETLLTLTAPEARAKSRSLEPIELEWRIPESDWAPTLRRFGSEETLEMARGAARGELRIDPTRPLDSSGWIELSDLWMKVGDHEIRSEQPVRLELAQGRVDLPTLRLLADEQSFELGGTIELDKTWQSDRSLSSLVEQLNLEGRGTLVAALLNPFLAGGSAEGLLDIGLDLRGSLEEPDGRIRVVGPDASILFLTPYVAKIEAPELDIELANGRAHLRDGRVRLNDGDVELGGSLGFDGIDLTAAFDGLRFRLDYGLLTRIDGDLTLTTDSEGRGRLSGELIVDQGSLTRPISIDRDFITQLLSPVDLVGTESSPLERIELDLDLETRRGVRVRNNVADLSLHWNGVEVRGTLAEPVIDGRFEVEPGGRVFLFGQTVRVDRGIVSFPGLPGAAATLDLETTSSFDDPSISRLQGDDALALSQPEPAEKIETRAQEAGWATAAFVGEQIAGRIADVVPGARLTFRPILIFGEADPGARLTIGREFSRYVTLAASIDLRNAERQTYLLDAGNLPVLPGLAVQVFTKYDQDRVSPNLVESWGATVQHRLRFGSYRRTAPTGPRLRRLEVDQVPGVSRRGLRRASGLNKGDRASIDDLFLAEVEIGEFLRQSGYPDARVKVTSRPVPERPRRVDVRVAIREGTFARFAFAGETMPKSLRRSITSLYRADFYEPVAIEEMRSQTVRSLRSLGYLDPAVDIVVDTVEGEEGKPERSVTIRSQGGKRLNLETLTVAGLSEAESEQVAARFTTTLQRLELAAGETVAEARLLSSIQALGYPRPEILGTRLSKDRREFTVEVDPGPLQRLRSVRALGVEADLASELVSAIDVGSGDPARRDSIVAGALAIEAALQRQGYADARVAPRLESGGEADGNDIDLVYNITPGIVYTVADTDISGLRSTSKRWATSVAEMESGAPLRESEVVAARSRLYDTGLFTMVTSDSVVTDGGRTEVVFDVEERPRYSVAYGLRWDDDDGIQGVIDAVDGNFLGRNVTLGLRGLYGEDDWSVRLAAGVPRLFGTKASLELFASYRDLFDELVGLFTTTQVDEQIVENSIQLAYPFGRHVFGRIYGRYRTDNLVLTDFDNDPIFPLPPTSLEFDFKTPLLGTLWTYDSRDRELVLTQGIFSSLDFSGTGPFLDSDFKYLRLFGQFNLYRRVGRWAGRRVSWAQSYRLGLADSFDQELDRNDRFFAGGQYSVRGYPTESLGPVEELGDDAFPLGGKSLLVINQELRFELLGPVAGVAFFDLGNVWEDTYDFDSDLFKSLGVGLRAITPVGLLRLDWAFPLDRREGDPSSKLYFGFGNTF